MKGLIISASVFALFAISSAVLSRILKPTRHSAFFPPLLLAWSPAYFAGYFLTPPDLGFLPASWTCDVKWLDITYGYVVYLLNCHSYIDMFFAVCGGFSTSLLYEIHRSGPEVTFEELQRGYTEPDGRDKIYEWRLPHLEKRRYIRIDAATNMCRLTAKGRAIARGVLFFKRFMNLGEGG